MEFLNQYYISEILGVIAVALVLTFKKGIKHYIIEKSKNWATIEDITKITEKIEKVRKTNLQQSHAWKQIFEKEYTLLEEVWSCTWEMQSKARSLRPIMDYLPIDKNEERKILMERHKEFSKSVNNYIEIVMKKRPFIPSAIYDECLLFKKVVVDLEVSFEQTFHDKNIPIKWEKIIENGEELDRKLKKLSETIRTYLHQKSEPIETIKH